MRRWRERERERERERAQPTTSPCFSSLFSNHSLEGGLHVRLRVQVGPGRLGALGEQLADALEDLRGWTGREREKK